MDSSRNKMNDIRFRINPEAAFEKFDGERYVPVSTAIVANYIFQKTSDVIFENFTLVDYNDYTNHNDNKCNFVVCNILGYYYMYKGLYNTRFDWYEFDWRDSVKRVVPERITTTVWKEV